MASGKLQTHAGQTKLVRMLKGFQGSRILAPKLVSEEEANKMPSPSEFLKEMSLSTEERLSSTRVMCRPQITELLDMGETTHQKFSTVDLDQTLFQPFPSEIVFQNYDACEVLEVPLILRNNDKIPRLVKIVEESSPYFKVISPNDICNKVAPGVPSTFRILFTPEENKDYSHVLTCVTEREKFIVPIKARGARAILDFPDELNFGVCPVKYSTQKILLVRNIGNREAVIHIQIRSPFSIEPSVGIVRVGDTMQLAVDFEPLILGDHSEKLIVNYDTGEKVCVSLYGAATDMNIRLDKNSLIIEKTYISLSNQRNIIIHNRSNIIAHFQWKVHATQEEEDKEKARLCDDLTKEEEKKTEELLQECVLDPSLREHLSVISHAFQNQRRIVQSNDMLFFGSIFVIEPVEGDVWPNSTTQISVIFNPREAKLYQQTIYCDISGRECRLPLRIKGEGMGPKTIFNFDVLDIGKAFVGSIHSYEAILSNKGSIDALFNLEPPTTPLGSCFIFNPKEGIVEPSGLQTIQISFSSNILGCFQEEFLFSINGSPEPVKLTIRGCVIGPTFHFNVPSLDFGDVSFGFPRTLTCSLNNTSLIPMTFKLRVPGDGVGEPSVTSLEQTLDIKKTSWKNESSPAIKPREFTIEPVSGTIRSQGFIAVRVTLCSNTVQKYQLALVVDVEGIGEEVLALLITARCVVPKLRVVNPELNYGYCFLKYPYKRKVQLVNDDDLPGCYGVLLQEYEESPTVLFSTPNPCGIINPKSTVELMVVLETQILGEHECNVYISVFGSKDPPLPIHLRSIGEGPVVNVFPDKIDFGNIYVLKDATKILHLSNQSFITACFTAHLLNRKSLWKISPEEGIVPPESEVLLTVTANLDDMLPFKDMIVLSIQNSSSYQIPVKAVGKGTTIVSDKPFAPELNLGAHFSVDPYFYHLKLTNKGRRFHQLFWMNEGFHHNNKQKRPHGNPLLMNNPHSSDPHNPVFQIHPVRMELAPGQTSELVLEGFSAVPKLVKERLVCYAIIGGNIRKTQLMTVSVICEFIGPLVVFSSKKLIYHLEKQPHTELEPQFKILTMKNVSSLLVRAILTTKEPFHLCDLSHSHLPRPYGPMEMEVGTEKKLMIKFDPCIRSDLNQWVAEEVLSIKYLEHPQVDYVNLRGEVHFPNLTFETMEVDFGCILNDTEEIRYIQMVNCSPLVVKFRWSFLVDDNENQIRFVTGQRKPYSAPVRVWSQSLETQQELLPVTPAPVTSPATPAPPSIAIETDEFVEHVILSENHIHEEGEKKLLVPSDVVTAVNTEPLKSSIEDVRTLITQSQVEFQDSLWIFEQDDSFNIGVEEVFDILPLYGVLPPLSSHQVSFAFYGHCDIIAQVKALCEVEGGPTYEIILKGEASLVSYKFDTKEINYGLQMFDHVMENDLTLKNIGKVGFEFKVLDGSQQSLDGPQRGMPLILPRSGFIHSNKEQVLKVYYLPGVPEVFERSFQIQIAHLEPETLTLRGEGIFPRISLDLPRNIKGNEKYEEFLREARRNLGKDSSKDELSIYPDPVTETTSEEDCLASHLDVQIQMEVERLIMRQHALDQQKLLNLEESFFSHRSRRKLLQAHLPEYILDFGYIILGNVRSHIVKITNTSSLPVSFHIEKSALQDSGFSVQLDRVRNLPHCETETFEVRCDPQAANVSVGNKEVILPIKVIGGPTLQICIRAKVTIPALSLSHDKLEFGTIQCGQCQVASFQLYNELSVPCDWSISNLKQTSKLDKRMPKYLRKKLQAELKPKLQAFEVMPMSGVLEPGERTNVQIKFMPSEEKLYTQNLIINIAHSNQKLPFLVQGNGLEPRLEFNPSVLELGPLLPFASGDEAEVIVKNPCNFPIEFYSLEFDQEYLLEEKILRNLKGYDATNTLLLPPRGPGEKLPPEVTEYYKELMRLREEQKSKPTEYLGQENVEEEESHSTEPIVSPSIKRASLSRGVSVTSNLEERHLRAIESRNIQSEEEEEDNLDRFFSHGAEKPQSASETRSVEEVGEIDNNPVSRCIARYLGISTSPDSQIAKHRRGIAIIVHGSPLSGKTATCNNLAKYYNAAYLTLDSIVLDALSDSNSIPGLRARELCMRATTEQSIRDVEESVKEAAMVTESSLAQTSIGLSRVSTENLAKHTSEATLASPDNRTAPSKGLRGSVIMNAKTKSDSHGSGSQKQHHQLHQSETSGSQIPSSPLTYTPIHLRLMGSSSEGDMGLFSTVLPDDLLVQIIEERIQLSDCYRGVVFDGIETVFARSPACALQCLLRAINNREHIYFVNVAQDYNVMKAREKAKMEKIEQEQQEMIAKEKARLQKMDEEEYDALTEEEKMMFDMEILQAIRERKKRKQEKLARELQEKRIQQELERQREEEEMKKKNKRKREPIKEELTVKKALGQRQASQIQGININAKSDARSDVGLERKGSMKEQVSGEDKKEEKRKRSKQQLGEMLPSQTMTEQLESERDLLRDAEKQLVQKFKVYEMNLKEIQQILMFWDRKQGIWIPHAGTEDTQHEPEEQRQAPSGRKGRKDRERERLERLEKERAEKERLEKEKAEKERLEKLKAMEDKSDGEVEEEDHEGKKDFGVLCLDFLPTVEQEFHWKQIMETEKLPSIEQMMEILDVGVAELPIPPPTLFSMIPFPPKRVPVVVSDILKHFTFVVPAAEDTATSEDKKETESEADASTSTPTAKTQEEQIITSKGRSRLKDKGETLRESTKEKRTRAGTSKKMPQVLPVPSITPLTGLDQSTFTTRQVQEKIMRLNNFRWIVPALGEVVLRVHFSSNETGIFDQTFNFEVLGTRRQYQLYCRGICTYPSISRDIRVVFPHWKKEAKPEEIICKKYIMNQEMFHFGPLLCGKSRDKYKAIQFPDNMEKLTILNNSPLPAEVTFFFQNDVKANTYILDPPIMNLKPNEKQILSVWAYPTSVGVFDDTIVCCIKENPEPAIFRITCQGIRPELELDHKQLHFEKLLLHRRETKVIFLRNITALPVAWRVGSLEHLGEDFSISKVQGIIQPGSEYSLQIHFQPTKAVNIKKAIRLEVLDAEYLIGVVQIENIQIFAESYDIALDITFPKAGNEGALDFGVVRVMEEVKQFLSLKNKGKYEIAFSFSLESLAPHQPNVHSILSTQPKKGSLTTADRPTNVQVIFRSKKEVKIENKPVLRCQIIEPNGLEGSEVIASIPIKFSVNVVFSRYAISPSSVINFGAMICGSRKTSTFIIENQGVLDFKFSISRLSRDTPFIHTRKTGTHNAKHARSKENVSFYRFSATKGLKGNDSMQKEMTSAVNQARFTLNMFSVFPAFGTVPPGGQQIITVDCFADPVGRCEEFLAIEISDRDPKDQPGGIPYTLIAEACLPAFVIDDMASIFEEHLICNNINVYQALQTIEGGGVFLEDENKFIFCNVLVGHQAKARFKLSNTGKIPCDISVSVKPVSNKVVNRITDIFEVEPTKLSIPSRSQAFATVTFTPPTMQSYQCLFEASLDGLPNFLSKNRSLTFDIYGEGNLPRVTVVRPILCNNKGNPLLLFKRLLVGHTEKLPLILKNNGTIPAQLHVDLKDRTRVFSLKGRPTTNYVYLTEENNPDGKAKKAHTAFLIIYPGETAEFDVHFKPNKVERVVGLIRLSVINNQYEETTIQLLGEGYEDDITLDNIHGLATSSKSETEITEVTEDKMLEELMTSARVDHLQFGDCQVGSVYEVTFTMTNRSQVNAVRFEWPMPTPLRFSPQAGHLHAGCSKDITVTLRSRTAVNLKKSLVKCKLSRIVFQQPVDQVPDWDNHMRTVKWIDSGKSPNMPSKKKVTETDPEPAYTVLEENYQDLDLYISAVIDYASFSSQVKEVNFKDTMVFQTRVFEFDLTNTGAVQLGFTWLLSSDEPAKAVSFANPQSSASRGPTGTIFDTARKELSSGGTFRGGSTTESFLSHAYSTSSTYPFSMEPISGVIPVGKSQKIKVKFSPLEVGEFENSIYCQIPNLAPGAQGLMVAVKGKSLLPYCHFDLVESDYISSHKRNPDLGGPHGEPLDVNTRVIEFSALGVGTRNIQTFTIMNPTNKTYSYRWVSEEEENLQNPSPFMCLTEGGLIHPEKKAEISFQFTPQGLELTEAFWTFLIPEHAISVPFLLVGRATDPLISLDVPHLTFSSLLMGHEARATVFMINKEEQEFNFAFEDSSCFSEGYVNNLVVKPMEGVIPGMSRLPIDIFFTPKCEGEMNFNLICRVKRKAKPLTLNVKAEGYNMKVEIRCKESSGTVIELSPTQTNVINFDEVGVNECVQCYFTLINPGKFNFNITSEINGPKSLQQYFVFSPTETMVEAGQSVSATLSFTPLKKCSVKGVELRLKVNYGPTYVCTLTGSSVTPAVHFSFTSHNFGTCFIYLPGMSLYKQTLVIKNNEDKPVNLDCLYINKAHLEVTWRVVVIKPGRSLEVPITFYPREAIYYKELIRFEINGLSQQIVEIQGRGTDLKVTVLDPENRIVKFGALLPGQVAKRTAVIVNHSLIPLTFNLITKFNVMELSDSKVLTVTPCYNITLKPQETSKVDIIFSPHKRVPQFNEEVNLDYSGCLRPLFLINGCCQALEITLDPEHIPFGAVVYQSHATRRLLMMNTGDIGARFQWDFKKFAPNFSITPTKGYITPGMEVAFEVTYRPTELGKESLYKNLPCTIQGSKPLLLTLSGVCVSVSGIKETVNFSCQVRSKQTQTIMLSNRTNHTWYLHPIFEGEHWEGPEFLVLEAHQQNRPYEITYRPLTMNADSRKHMGSVFFPLPDGTGWLYILQGTAEAPKAVANIYREVPCKTPYVELLPVENWLNKVQRFRVIVDMIKPEKQDLSMTIKGLDYIDVLAGSKRDYKLNFFSYKEGIFSAKVIFRNEVTGEYLFYLVSFKVLSAGIIKTIDMTTFVRQSTSASIKVENPLPYSVFFTTDCRVPDISIPSQFVVQANSEGTISFDFQPLKAGETVGRLNLHQSDLGTYQYELNLKALPGRPEKPVYFQVPLGSSQALNAKFINYTRQKTEYACKTDNQDFHVEKIVYAAPGGQGGTEVSVEVNFEPSQLGEMRGNLYVSSPIGGEYVIPLIGLAQYPKPQGPIQIKAGSSTVIPFKNVFYHQMTYSIIVESPSFSVKAVDTVRSKKINNITISFEGNTSGHKTPITSKLIVSCLGGTGNEAGIKWIYYLKGITP